MKFAQRNHIPTQNQRQDNVVDSSKPTAVFKPVRGRFYTVSVALPGSIIANAQTHDIKTALAGQIARALAVFCVDEVIIFDDGHNALHNKYQDPEVINADRKSGYTAFTDPNHFLFHVLSYLETPPQFRRLLFPYHPNLRTAGALNSLDMPHHLRVDEWCQYREGVTIAEWAASVGPNKSKDAKFHFNHTTKPKKKRRTSGGSSHEDRATHSTLVDAGFPDAVTVPPKSHPVHVLLLNFPLHCLPELFTIYTPTPSLLTLLGKKQDATGALFHVPHLLFAPYSLNAPTREATTFQ